MISSHRKVGRLINNSENMSLSRKIAGHKSYLTTLSDKITKELQSLTKILLN